MNALRDEAIMQLRTARGQEEKTASRNAMERASAIEEARREVQDRQWQEFEAARRPKVATPWISLMLKEGLLKDGADSWGFLVFRTGCYNGEEGEAAWRRFRRYFAKAAETMVLHWDSGPLLWPKFHAIFVEDKELDGASNEQLRTRFKEMRDGDGGERLPKGIRTNCFLVADQAVIESEAAKTPYIVRYDPPPSVHILPEDPVVYIRALDPDYEDTTPEAGDQNDVEKDQEDQEEPAEAEPRDEIGSDTAAQTEKLDEMVGFTGEVRVALPRVFDWLHCVCFNAERGTSRGDLCNRTGWHAIYVQTKVPEAWERDHASYSGTVHYARIPRAAKLQVNQSPMITSTNQIDTQYPYPS